MKILVMRPSPLGEELVDNLNKLNIDSWHFSLFDFSTSSSKNSLSKKIVKLHQSNIVVVFSKMSIYYTNLYLKNHNLRWPINVAYYAIGNSTAYLLNQYTKKKVFFPKKKENSEELLNTLYKNTMENRIKKDKIILLQGENGRNFFQEQLLIKGFQVNLIECYKRVWKTIAIKKEIKKWYTYGINTLIITNGETLYELNRICFSINQTAWLLKCKIFVVSNRLLILAKQLGWKKIIVSHYANNDFLLKIIKKNK